MLSGLGLALKQILIWCKFAITFSLYKREDIPYSVLE
jgi:hypothetical protein